MNECQDRGPEINANLILNMSARSLDQDRIIRHASCTSCSTILCSVPCATLHMHMHTHRHVRLSKTSAAPQSCGELPDFLHNIRSLVSPSVTCQSSGTRLVHSHGHVFVKRILREKERERERERGAMWSVSASRKLKCLCQQTFVVTFMHVETFFVYEEAVALTRQQSPFLEVLPTRNLTCLLHTTSTQDVIMQPQIPTNETPKSIKMGVNVFFPS
jgi:hypothetical protein